jgi:phenylpropionate dioxygenase-like ring-hydroxylating dioxygenase large terminal subunit
MLSKKDNERLVRVAAGEPAGELFRRYWQPALLSSELPENDGGQIEVRLLGEDLIAFRDTNGKVGLVDAFCPHRRAPMFYARNEECGLRCVYHGWKFDVTGKCVEVPNEPAGSPMKDKVRITAYPTFEGGGIVWAYMGPADQMPAVPDYEWIRVPHTHRHVSKTFESCNYLQALEGGLDTSHSSFLHNNKLGDNDALRQRDRAPQIDVYKSEYGYQYVSTRKAGADGHYIRVYQYFMPAQALRGGVAHASQRNEPPKIDGHIWVPIDDEHTHVYNLMYGYDESVPISPEYAEQFESFSGRGKEHLIPGTFKLKLNPSNKYMIDRQVQKTKTFTGIKGLNTQDFALQEGMGAIVDRSKEYLGTADKAIIEMRKLMLEATRDVEEGRPPRGTNAAACHSIRPFDGIVPAGQEWRDALSGELNAKW